ncbi:MAG: DUF4097 family beta strand repeat-containing protein [Blastocatellia bacterium]|nr:DUF4097 family beta strand repeat-containing protein [Blastocatellia bacterium]
MASKGNKKRGTLMLGLLLLAVGLIFIFFPASTSLAEWLMRLWPVFLICAGVVRVMGFAIERKPRSPVGGMLLIIIGVLFLAGRFHSNLNALQIYGRYWLLLLAVFAAVELLRFYSHRHTEGPPPRLFTPWRLIFIAFIVSTGVLANRMATNNPSLLSALKLDGFLSELRDSVVGQTYTFKDEPFVANAIEPGIKITVNNSYGSVKVTGGGGSIRATLAKGVRAWDEEDARKIAERIRLVVKESPGEIYITTNRAEVDHQFTTDIQIEVPYSSAVSVTGSYGPVIVNSVSGDVAIKLGYDRADVTDIKGNVNLDLTYSDAGAANINGNLTIKGAKRARVANVTGSLDLAASNGSVELRDITGRVRVDAPFCRINAQGLSDVAQFKTEHGKVNVTRAASLVIVGPHSDIRAETVDGDLTVQSSHSDITLRSIEGRLAISAQHSSVNTDGVRGPITVETSHRSVTVKNFYESVRVLTSFQDVTLVADSQPAGNIEVENIRGAIKLILPQSSRFQLDALSENGQVRPIGFGELPRKPGESLISTLGSEGPTIKLKTSYRNITIQASKDRQAQDRGPVN